MTRMTVSSAPRMALGCDPGLTGGIALVCSRRGLLQAERLPARQLGSGSRRIVDARALRIMLACWSSKWDLSASTQVVAVIEQMQTMAANDRATPWSMLSMGLSAGVAEGVIAAYSTDTLNPAPATWKGALGLIGRRSRLMRAEGIGQETTAQRKARAHTLALRLYPTMGRVPHDVAEAVLIAHWGLGIPVPTASRAAQSADTEPLAF